MKKINARKQDQALVRSNGTHVEQSCAVRAAKHYCHIAATDSQRRMGGYL